jgi:hypothetical protein
LITWVGLEEAFLVMAAIVVVAVVASLLSRSVRTLRADDAPAVAVD